MKQHLVFAFAVGIAFLILFILFYMWKQSDRGYDWQSNQTVQSSPVVKEAAISPSPTPGMETEMVDELPIVDPEPTPESFHELVDDLAEAHIDEDLQFIEEEWETMEGDAETVPPIFRIAP